MEKINGIIEEEPKITEGTKKDGTPYKRIGIKVGGKMFGTFDEEHSSLKVGDSIEMEYTISEPVNGRQFNNIDSVKILGGQKQLGDTKVPEKKVEPVKEIEKVPEIPIAKVPVVESAAPAKRVGNNYYDTEKIKSASIVSQVIIKAVAEMVSSGNIKPGEYKTHAASLVDVYKKTMDQLLE